MADFMEIIKGRRGIRKYKDLEVSKEDLDKVLEAIRWSPSWANTQCWETIVVKNLETKQNIQEALSQSNPAREACVKAPVLITLCGKLQRSGYYNGKPTTKFGDWFMFDLGICTQSLCLAAHHLNLATVIVGLFDHDKVKGILNVPEGYEVVALIPLGYSAKEARAPKRREISEFVHYDRF
jgi:nitroreductase